MMNWLGPVLTCLFAASPVIAVPTSLLPNATNIARSTVCNGQTYQYLNLSGYGYTASDSRDKFGDTAGGIGSSAAIEPQSWRRNRNTYTGTIWTLPDRGWNTEGTLNYQPRVHKFTITLILNDSATAQTPSKPNIKLDYLDTILLADPSGTPVTGLDPDFTEPYLTFPGFPDLPSATYTGDGFGGNGTGGRRVSIDSEGLVLNRDGTFWVSDEYGPYIYLFSARGTMLSAIRPADAVIPRRNGTQSFSAASPPRYDPSRKVVPTQPNTGRINNQGLEGLTASPDGKTLYALMQSALSQDGGSGRTQDRRNARLLIYDVSKPKSPKYTAEYVVPLPLYNNNTRVAAQSEIKYISKTQFLVLARDSGAGRGQGNRTTSLYRQADVFDISNATNVVGLSADCSNCSIASSSGVLKSNIVPATYCSFLDYNINSQLNRFGVHNGGAQDVGLLNEKWESFALVPVNAPRSGSNRHSSNHQKSASSNWDWGFGTDYDCDGNDEYFLFSLSDNDFITQNGYLKGGQFKYADESGYDLLNQVLAFRIKLPAGSKPRIG